MMEGLCLNVELWRSSCVVSEMGVGRSKGKKISLFLSYLWEMTWQRHIESLTIRKVDGIKGSLFD
jgi:hypothetical protein